MIKADGTISTRYLLRPNFRRFFCGRFSIAMRGTFRGLALDVAAGTGRNAIFLAERGFRVVAIDISSIALEEARRRAEKKSLAIS